MVDLFTTVSANPNPNILPATRELPNVTTVKIFTWSMRVNFGVKSLCTDDVGRHGRESLP